MKNGIEILIDENGSCDIRVIARTEEAEKSALALYGKISHVVDGIQWLLNTGAREC
jgi:hypothetical protein